MIVTHRTDEFGRLEITAETEEYDASRIAPPLIVDGRIHDLPESRLALAEALFVLDCASGRATLDARLHPATAELLEVVSGPTWVHFEPIRFGHADIPDGSTRIYVIDGLNLPVELESLPEKSLRIHILPAHDFIGSMATMRHRWFPTTTLPILSDRTGQTHLWHRRLATVVLLASVLNGSALVLPRHWTEDRTDLDFYRRLLRTTGLTFE